MIEVYQFYSENMFILSWTLETQKSAKSSSLVKTAKRLQAKHFAAID